MSNIKEVRDKINSIRNIQKMSKAMEMLSVSKMQKARTRMLMSQPYSETIRKIIYNVSSSQLEYKHTFFTKRDIPCIGYWIVSTDRGLAGGLNINLFRKLLYEFNKWNLMGVKIKLSIIGLKGIMFFKNYIHYKIVGYVSGINDNPKISKLIGIIKLMLQLYEKKQIGKLFLAYNKCVNTVSQTPQILQILPILPIKIDDVKNQLWDYLYEPDSKLLLDILLYRYVELQVYQGVVENLASEQSARMMAMKTASENGEILINNLKLFYNKIRQMNITQELSEIITGASVIL